jgi:Uma2 family endonuclease
MALGWRTPLIGVGNVTIHRATVRKGLEPDVCFYVQHAAQVRGVFGRDLDFATDPPPDLAVEVVMTAEMVGKLPVYAALGVPEVWRWDGQALTFLHLTAGDYAARPASLAFPGLTPDDLARYLRRAGTVDETTLCREALAWAASNPETP